MAVQVRVIYETNYVKAEEALNKELLVLKDQKIRDVKIDTDWSGQEDHYIGLIVYEE